MSQVEITKRMVENEKQLNFSKPLDVKNTFFQWYDQAREKYQWKTWVVAIIEFIGTFLMTFLIIAPSTFQLYDAATYGDSSFGKGIELIFSFMFMRAAWVAFGIWVLIILFNKISININPAVTIAEMGAHNHLRAQGVVKIFAQVTGAIAASYIALYLGLAWMGEVTSIDSIQLGVHNSYQIDPSAKLGFTISSNNIVLSEHQAYIAAQFFMEFILTFLLLLAIFSTDHIRWSVRSWILAFALVIIVSIGIRTDNIALNPARLIGPAMASATYNLNHAGTFLNPALVDEGAIIALPLMLLAELSAALLMYYIQGSVKTKFENISTIKKDEIIKLAWAKILTLEVLLNEVSFDKETLYQMNPAKLKTKAEQLGIKNIEKMTQKNLINKISLVLIERYLNDKLKNKENEIFVEENNLAKEVRRYLEVADLTAELTPKAFARFKKAEQNSRRNKPIKNLSSAEKKFKKRIINIKKTIIEKHIN